ncbi:MAG: S8 family serine peptidase, partial [Promethearchaeota archaeon]
DPGTPGVLYPGKFTEVIATASISSSLRASYFSRRGPETEICAPGGDLPSIGGLSGSGTSFAAPHVSGCIALMKTMNQSLTPEDIRRILAETSTDLGTPGRDDVYGYGLLNVTNAVRGAAGMQTWNLTKDIIPTTGTTETTESTSTFTQSSEKISSSQLTSSIQTNSLLISEALLFTLILVIRKKSR